MMYDLGLATQNIGLMAHHLGLGTVVNLPDGYELLTLIPLGYPAKVSSAPPRRETRAFTHNDHF
jgi:nitroreductase